MDDGGPTSGFYTSTLNGPECPLGKPGEPCWGEVAIEDWTDGEDGATPNYRCRGHRDCHGYLLVRTTYHAEPER